MKVRFLGAHNTESHNTRLASLLVDGVLALDAGSITSNLSFAQQLKLRAVLVTHHHYDHIRDIPLLAMNLFLNAASIDVYSIQSVGEELSSHLLNGSLYPRFMEEPEGKPVINFHTVKPYQEFEAAGYSVLPLPVAHSVPAVGYQVTSADSKRLFYGGDTGPGLADCWRHISPRLIVIEVTAPNRFEQFGREKGHLTPSLLRQELLDFQKARGYIPDVISVHMNPSPEAEIEAELAAVARELGNSISLAYEGRQINI